MIRTKCNLWSDVPASDVDRKVLSRGYLFAEADLEATAPAELVASLTGWDWCDAS
jgi:hypothetical protein